jgi:catechol 2,3-dioxygenase-like lactoylglutathione lyase family enzyme
MTFWHVGILTPDIEKTLGTLCAVPGCSRDKWTVLEVDFAPSDMVAGAGGKLKIAFGRMGSIVHELIEPLDETSYHAQALRQRGPGYNHTAYVCGDGLDAVIASCVASGARIVWEARHGDEHACYVESADGGSLWELINVCPFMPEA